MGSMEEKMDITIRKMKNGDFEALCRLLSDRDVMCCLEPPYDIARTKEFLESAGLAENPLVYAAEQNGEFIGYVIYHAYDEKSMEIGWVLFKEYWGRGYASVLTDMLVSKAIKEQKDAVIECMHEQEATRYIALKKGFEYCGISDGLEIYRLKFLREKQ